MPITQPSSNAQLDFIQSAPLGTENGAAVYTSANLAILTRFRVAKAMTITTMTCFVQTASGSLDMGIYTSVDFTTYSRLGSTGSTLAAGSSVNQAVALTASVTLQPGVDYFLAFASDNTTLSIGRLVTVAAIGGYKNQNLSKAASFPLPSTISSPGQQAYVPWVAAA